MFLNIVAPNLPLLGLAAAAFEFTIALLILSKRKYVKLGLGGGILFLLGIMPQSGKALAKPVMAVALVLLIRKGHDQAALDMLRSKLRPPSKTVEAGRGTGS